MKKVYALQNGLRDLGFDIGNPEACVTPVYMKGTVGEAGALVKDLRETHGIFCSVVLPPMIPKGTILLRMIPTATHTDEDIQLPLDAFAAVRKNLILSGECGCAAFPTCSYLVIRKQ